jgi:hypothetical protein
MSQKYERAPLTPFAEQEYDRQIAFRRRGAATTTAETTEETSRGHRMLLERGTEEDNLFPSLRGPRGAVEFFRERRIAWWSLTKTKDRPSGHLASSQVSCVNFSMPPAVEHPTALVALLQEIDQDVIDVVPIEHEGRRSLVEFEWVGVSGPLEPGDFVRGELCTSIDALILGRTAHGGIRAYFLEWKYTERCGERLGPGKNSTRLARYERLYRSSDLFRLPMESLLYEPAYQIVRSLLLGFRTVKHRELGVTEARTVVICPDANESYRLLPPEHALAAGKVVSVRDLVCERALLAVSQFRLVSQGQLFDRILASGASTPEGWVDYHRGRYAWR